MSIEVRIPKEITEYKEKILFGLTIRQLLCFILAIATGLGSYFLISKCLGTDIAGYIVILEVIPIFATGFFRKDGFNFEKYIKLMLRHKLGQSKRKYITQLSMDKNNTKRWKNDKSVSSKKLQRQEYQHFEITKKDRKRKLKEVKRKIKEAGKEFIRAKQKAKKTAAATKASQKCSANHQI